MGPRDKMAVMSAKLLSLFPDPYSATSQSEIVGADAETTYAALRTTDFERSRGVRFMSTLRGIPDRVLRMLRGQPARPKAEGWTIADLVRAGYWVVLEDEAPRRLTLGLSLWDPRLEDRPLAQDMVADPAGGAIAVGWGFEIDELEPHATVRLTTSTRTRPADGRALRRFRLYWFLIAPFASMTRRMVLRVIAREAERRYAAAAPELGSPVAARSV